MPAYSILFDEFSDFINYGLHSNSFKFICIGDFNYNFDSISQPIPYLGNYLNISVLIEHIVSLKKLKYYY